MRKNRSLTTMPGLVIPTLKSLPVAALLLAGMAACSDENMPDGNGDEQEPLELQSSALNVMTDPAKMPATVYNYVFGNSAKTRATDEGFTMPDVPEALKYEGLDEYENTWWAPDCPKKDFKITKDCNLGFKNVGQEMYVAPGAKWTITGTDGGGSATIWVLPGATLEFTGGGFEAAAGHITIYNYGTLAFNNGENQCRLGGNLTVYSQTAIDQIPNLNLACEFSTNGAVKVKRVHFNNAANVRIGCKIEATEEVIFDNISTFNVGYIKSPKIELWSTPKVVVRDGGYIKTDELNIRNVQTSQIYAEAGVALIQAGTILVNNAGGDNLKNTFGNINILCDKWVYGENVEPTKKGLGLNANVKLNEEVDVKLETGDSCAPVWVTPKDDETEDKPSLETIASVTNEHTHPISATCIQFSGNKAYVSWHERGTGIHGCVEVVENTPEGLKLLAYAEDENTDYNHILVDGNRLLTVGHNDKNAVVGEIALENGSFAQGETLSFVNLKGNKVPHKDNPEFYGGDGNCIVRNGNYLSVASYGGLHTLNSDLSRMEPTSGAAPTTGSAKHLSLVGGKLLELNLTARVKDAKSSPAELRLFEASDYTWSKPTVIASDLTITPVDGKNTIALDNDGSMYVCLGHGGVKKYTGNSCVATITENNAPANGLCLDDKYLYVAFGKGLYIYAKDDLSKPVLKYTHIGRTKDGGTVSCNYVAVNGNLIYLAYGRDGYDVLRMKNR